MALDVPVFLKRTGSAIVFAAIMLCGLLWKDWMFLVLVLLIQVLCLPEYFKLAGKINERKVPLWLVIAVQVIGAYLLLLIGMTMLSRAYVLAESIRYDHIAKMLFYATPILIIVPVIMLLAATLSKGSFWTECQSAFTALAYIVLPCLFFLGMRAMGNYLPIVLVVCIWINDTMAYIVGSFIGKTPFSPISPKKTWEGTAGGAMLTVVTACVVAYFWAGVSMRDAVALSLCAAIAGTAGDLLESKLKRMAGVKDSGNIMPGHGGALDRFDSLLVAIPFAFCYLVITHLF